MLYLLARIFLTGNYSEDCLIGWTSVWKEILLTRQNENSNSKKGKPIPFFCNINTQLQLKWTEKERERKWDWEQGQIKKRRPNSWGLQFSSAPQVFWLETDLEKKGREGDRCAGRPVLHLLHLFPVKNVTQFIQLCSCKENRLEIMPEPKNNQWQHFVCLGKFD